MSETTTDIPARGGPPRRLDPDADLIPWLLSHIPGKPFNIDIEFSEINGSRSCILGFACKPINAPVRLTVTPDTFLGIGVGNVSETLNTLQLQHLERVLFPDKLQLQRGVTRVTWAMGRVLAFQDKSIVHEFDVPPNFTTPYIVPCFSDTSMTVVVTVHEAALKPPAMDQLLDRSKFTDATVKCDGREFHVHRAVLATVSEVFDNMFSSGMQEGVHAVIEIEDSTPEEVQAFIGCVYSGKLPDKSLLPGIWFLANKYLLKDMASTAMQVMLDQMDANSASDVARVLQQHTADGSAPEMWSALLEKVSGDPGMFRKMVEGLADGPRKRPRRA